MEEVWQKRHCKEGRPGGLGASELVLVQLSGQGRQAGRSEFAADPADSEEALGCTQDLKHTKKGWNDCARIYINQKSNNFYFKI